jgi:hypothetical protein
MRIKSCVDEEGRVRASAVIGRTPWLAMRESIFEIREILTSLPIADAIPYHLWRRRAG